MPAQVYLNALITVSKGSVTKQIPKHLEEQYKRNGWTIGMKPKRGRTVPDGD